MTEYGELLPMLTNDRLGFNSAFKGLNTELQPITLDFRTVAEISKKITMYMTTVKTNF